MIARNFAKEGIDQMEKQVNGFILHSSLATDSENTYDVYLITWTGQHIHQFSGTTFFDTGHKHTYSGNTQQAQSGVPHIHRSYTITSIGNGHSHVIYGVTGPAITYTGGGHYHWFGGITKVDGRTTQTQFFSGKKGITGKK
jgi:hypothetical protein